MSESRALERFQELLRIPTISRLDPADLVPADFERFVRALERLYPLLHSRLTREIVADHSLLFRWAGRSSTEPTVLMAHYDVVAATDYGWEHPPFDAHVTGEDDDRVIWGRGTIDDKGSVVAILEAVERLLEQGHEPAHDVYLSFGHDEETHGSGARAIAELLAERGVRPALVLDEGGAVALEAFPGVARPIAAVGVSEKGATLVRLSVDQQGGHSSTPPRWSATARLARAIVRLNERPFPARIPAPVMQMLRTLAPYASGSVGRVLRGLPATATLVRRVFARSDETRAMMRTTQAVTILDAGHAANALPEHAEAMVNIRVSVDSTVDAAVAHVRRAIGDDAVHVDLVTRGEPAPISPTSGQGWRTVTATIATTFPEAVITPYVQTGATDSRFFTALTPAVYRFTPFVLDRAERDTLHAKNERIRVRSWLTGIEFYRDVLLRV